METYDIIATDKLLAGYTLRTKTDEWGDKMVSGLFVRWTNTPERDITQGLSTNWATGNGEMGLSVNELHWSQTWHGIDTGRTTAQRVAEYEYLALGRDNVRPWIIEGWRPADPTARRGSDNEPLIDPIAVIGPIDLRTA